jgi:hypothetical protein
MTEGGPLRVPRSKLEEMEEIESARRCAGTDALDIATLRYAASEAGKPALVVWLDRHSSDYGRGLLDGFEVED